MQKRMKQRWSRSHNIDMKKACFMRAFLVLENTPTNLLFTHYRLDSAIRSVHYAFWHGDHRIVE